MKVAIVLFLLAVAFGIVFSLLGVMDAQLERLNGAVPAEVSRP